MNHGPLLFLGVLGCVVASWLGLVVGPHFQFGNQELVVIEETGANYPSARDGLALQGAEVYRANGCNYCHTQQVRGASEGADIARGWGKRRTVARDYLRDRPVMLGNHRFGPDLANIGARQYTTNDLYLKLYNARLLQPKSTMPRYPYLFEERRLAVGGSPAAEALQFPPGSPAPAGVEVVPTAEALALVAYLQSLKSEALFYEVFPTPKPKPATNVVEGVDTNALAAGGVTNAAPGGSTNPAPAL
jgi:cytochrome c oxidase cbb3-type subunit 2